MACVGALQRSGAEIAINARRPTKHAPFDLHVEGLRVNFDTSNVFRFAYGFRPDSIVLGGWCNPAYVRLARVFYAQGKPVILAADEPWEGGMKQRLKLSVVRRRIVDVATHIWIPGHPQVRVAKRLGFRSKRILSGMYACDFQQFYRPVRMHQSDMPHFLFVGRLEPIKGVNTLLNAYREYQRLTDRPWGLRLAGAGSLVKRVKHQSDVEYVSFVQPNHLPSLYRRASAFVLPSRYEPWGVVIHEAAASGLPLICSDRCGAASQLLKNNKNGLTFAAGSAVELTECLSKISRMPASERIVWAQRSQDLARQLTPEVWAKTLLTVAEDWSASK